MLMQIWVYIYIYIYVCVCEYMCVCVSVAWGGNNFHLKYSIQVIYNFPPCKSFYTCYHWWSFTGVSVKDKSPKVTRTLHSNLADRSNAKIWIVSFLPKISIFSIPFLRFLRAVYSVPTMIGSTLTLMFHSFFQFSSKVQGFVYLYFFFSPWSAKTAKSSRRKIISLSSFFFFFLSMTILLLLYLIILQLLKVFPPLLSDDFVALQTT